MLPLCIFKITLLADTKRQQQQKKANKQKQTID